MMGRALCTPPDYDKSLPLRRAFLFGLRSRLLVRVISFLTAWACMLPALAERSDLLSLLPASAMP
ncbi:hypothetical protein KM92DES2_11210 [uncultured Desulfovibrio sp.]|uniref:Uncharacterized protein n=1 Tax=uncultured Desulfovibrio sp. TaxID=167968 RepID=A0A212JJ00_9BACT|nr:hypothetical protein KM92DES2_11210 [uncultured Desulfovibrio sp.]